MQVNPEELKIYLKDRICTTFCHSTNLQIYGEARYNRFKVGYSSGFIEALVNLYYDIADALIAHSKTGKQENPYVFGLDHSMKGVELFTTAQMSNNERSWVELTE